MDYMKDKYPALFVLLEKRLELAGRYLGLTEKQEDAIAADDDAALLELLEERESLAKEIDGANREAEAALREYRSFSENGSGTVEAETLIERTRELYVKCLTLDRKNAKEIKSQMAKASGDSRELQKRREGINKYAQADYIFAPSILDKRQ